MPTVMQDLPPALRRLANEHEERERATAHAEAERARAELAQLNDAEPRRLLAEAARLRGQAEALTRKAAEAKDAADTAHAAYVAANVAHGEHRKRLRLRSIAPHVLAEAFDLLEIGRLRLDSRYRLGTPEHRAARHAHAEVLLRFGREVLAPLRDGAADPPTRSLRELVTEAVTAAEVAGREAAEACEAARERERRRAEHRRLWG
jgi:hypothetical protein